MCKCEFCGRLGPSEDRCLLKPHNPNYKLTPKMLDSMSLGTGMQSPANRNIPVADGHEGCGKQAKVELAGSIVDKTTIDPVADMHTCADSDDSVHRFHRKSAFVKGTLVQCEHRAVMLTDNTLVAAKL